MLHCFMSLYTTATSQPYTIRSGARNRVQKLLHRSGRGTVANCVCELVAQYHCLRIMVYSGGVSRHIVVPPFHFVTICVFLFSLSQISPTVSQSEDFKLLIIGAALQEGGG